MDVPVPNIFCLIHGPVVALEEPDSLRICPQCDFAQRFLRQAKAELKDALKEAFVQIADLEIPETLQRIANVMAFTAPECRDCDHRYVSHEARGRNGRYRHAPCTALDCECVDYFPKDDYVPL